MFTLLAPFPGPANAVIVTPTPLKADVVPNAGVVITPHLGGVCFQLCQCHPHCCECSAVDLKINRLPIENNRFTLHSSFCSDV